MSYKLLDSGNQQKLEQFGDYIVSRPCSQALWLPTLPVARWKEAHATFTREDGNRWHFRVEPPASWKASIENLLFKISLTDFGHVGVFPEHSNLWAWMEGLIRKRGNPNVLNLFAYSGGATLAAARAGARVCHLDASKGMVQWARENAAFNRLDGAPIRWIVDDVMKFLNREIKRGVRYDAIILDPPSFGRGNQGEVFKIERDLQEILNACRTLLTETPLFMILSSHTPGMTPLVMQHLMHQTMQGVKGKIESGELVIPGKKELPSGSYGRWSHE
jgi:23S rRNA (cytosine1962-C5)-methyltransferase